MLTLIVVVLAAVALYGLWPITRNCIWWYCSEQVKKESGVDVLIKDIEAKGLQFPCPVGVMSLAPRANGSYLRWQDGTDAIVLNTRILDDLRQVRYTLLHERQHALGTTDEIACEVAAYGLIRAYWPEEGRHAQQLFEKQMKFYQAPARMRETNYTGGVL